MIMNKLRIFLVFIFVIACSSGYSSEDKSGDDFLKSLEVLRENMGSLRVGGEVPKIDSYQARFQAASKVSKISFPAIFQLWICGDEKQEDFFELIWWKKRNDNKLDRMLVVALYKCMTVEPVASKPNFIKNATRFEDVERVERNEEITYIINNRQCISGILAGIISNIPENIRTKKISDLLKMYSMTSKSDVNPTSQP